jgi:Domain of unknown function (DUF1992)
MGLQHIDMEAALRRLADRRIEDAMKEGKFDNLPGAGKPLDLEPMPAEENARLTWWALRILKNNDFTPEEIRWRKAIDHLKSRLASATEEAEVIRLVAQANELARKVNTLGTNAMKTGVALLDEAEYLQCLRDRRP